jgi:thioredoxin
MVNEFSKQEFYDEVKKGGIIIIDFHAQWCGPCKSFSNIFNKVAEEMAEFAIFAKINIDEQRDLAIEYKVSSIPNLVIVKDGVIMYQHVGVMDETTLINKIKTILK